MTLRSAPSFYSVRRQPLWKLVAKCLLALLFGLPLALWGAGALWFRLSDSPGLRLVLLVLWCAAIFLPLIWAWRHQSWLSLALCWLVSFVCILLWWSQIKPSDDRQWAADVAKHVQVTAVQEPGQRVQLSNVRNFLWRSETDFDARWEPRSYDLAQLQRVDVALSYWMGPAIAHTLVSFGFADGQHLVYSIEIRKEQGEQFDALAGFFKQYEMTLIAADERDILAVRTNARGETVHLYQVQMPQQAMRELFMAYARQAGELIEEPRFYNTLTANCTTIVWELARSIGAKLPLDWRMLASGYLPDYLYSFGVLVPGYTAAQLEQAGNITERAKAWQAPAGSNEAEASADFSRAIRMGMPALVP